MLPCFLFADTHIRFLLFLYRFSERKDHWLDGGPDGYSYAGTREKHPERCVLFLNSVLVNRLYRCEAQDYS